MLEGSGDIISTSEKGATKMWIFWFHLHFMAFWVKFVLFLPLLVYSWYDQDDYDYDYDY